MPRYNYATNRWEKTKEEEEKEQQKIIEEQQKIIEEQQKQEKMQQSLQENKKKKKSSFFDNWIKTPDALKDGYDFGDITKTILGTGIKGANEFTKGVLNIGEGIGDAITYGESYLLKKTGWFKDYIDPEDLKKEAQKDIFNNLFKESDEVFGKNSITDTKTDNIINSLGYMYGLQATASLGGSVKSQTLISTAVTFESSYGHSLTEAYNNGASDKDAHLYALISASAEAGSELMFGGIGKGTNAVGLTRGVGGIDDQIAHNLSQRFKSNIMQNLTEWIVKSGGEGIEEVVSGYFSALGKKITYMKDEDFEKILEDENLLDQFTSGVISSGISSAPGMIQSTKKGKNLTTGRTDSEQQIYDKMIENKTNEKIKEKVVEKKLNKEVAKYEKKFNNEMSNVAKENLKEKIINELNKKGIDSYNIELTKKEQSEIKNLVEEEFTNGKLDINEIYDLYTPGETRKINDLKKKLGSQLYENSSSELNQQLSELEQQRYDKIVKESENDSFIQHTLYNQQLKSTKFKLTQNEKNLIKNNSKLKDLYKDAKNYSNNTEEAHKFVNILSKMVETTDYSYRLTNSEELKKLGYSKNIDSNETVINGLHDGSNKTIYINMDSDNALNLIVGHETGHIFENTSEYKELSNLLFEIAKQDGTLESRKNQLQELYKNVKNADIDVELTNDLLGEKLFTDEKFIERLSEKPTIFNKIKDKIDDLIIKFKGTDEEKQLRKVQNMFLEVYRKKGLDKYSDVSDKKINEVDYSISKRKQSKDDLNSTNYDLENNSVIDYNIDDGWWIDRFRKKHLFQNEVIPYIIVDERKVKFVPYSNCEDFFALDFKTMDSAIAIGSGYAAKAQNDGFTSFSFYYKNYQFFADILDTEQNTFGITRVRTIKEISEEVWDETNITRNSENIEDLAKNEQRVWNWNNKSSRYRGTSIENAELLERKQKQSRINENRQIDEKGIRNKRGELGNSSFSFDENAKRFEDLKNTNKIEFYKSDNMIIISLLDSNNKIVNEINLSSRDSLIKELGEEIGEYVFNNAVYDYQTIDIENDINNLETENDYFMNHRPNEDGATADNLSNQDIDIPGPKDLYEHPEYYFQMNEKYSKESMDVLKKIKDKPNAFVTIYRATPGNEINPGDWVTLSKSYAELHNKSQFNGKANIVEMNVKAKDIRWGMDDINEFGYFPTKESLSLNSKKQKDYIEIGTNRLIRNMDVDQITYQEIDDLIAYSPYSEENYIDLSDVDLDEINMTEDEVDEHNQQVYEDVYNQIEKIFEKEGISQRYEHGETIFDRQELAIKGYNELLNYLDSKGINYEISKSTDAGYVPSIYIKDSDGNTEFRIANHDNGYVDDFDMVYNDSYNHIFSDKDYANWKDNILPVIEKTVDDLYNTESLIDNENNYSLSTKDNQEKNLLDKENQIAPINEDYRVYSKDIGIKENFAPIRTDITQKDAKTIEKQYKKQPIPEELPRINYDNEVSEQDIQDSYKNINEINERSMEEVGNRGVKSYQYEHPVVKPYFQEMATYMLSDLDNSVKGERYATQDLEFGGVKRQTTTDIAYLLDEYNYSYDDIRKGLNAIIEDHGAENIAVSKRLEILINDRLLNGYKDMNGYDIPANEDYKNLLENRTITDYYDNLEIYGLNDYTQEMPVKPTNTSYKSNNKNMMQNNRNVAPIRSDIDYNSFDDMLPIKNELERLSERDAEKYKKKREKYQQQIENAKKIRKEKKSQFTKFKDNFMSLFVNENHEIDKLSKDSKNSKIKHKADMLNNYVVEAENDINNYQTDYNGKEIGKSVKQLFQPAKDKGLYNAFNDYLINWSNIDRHKQGKGSLRLESTSQKLIQKYEEKYPEFKKWGKDVWQYGKNALNTMEQAGLIDKKLKKTLNEMYPHYVPFMDNADLNYYIGSSDEIVPKSTIKTAKGGMSTTEILPMEEALTKYAYSYRKSMRQNDLYSEIVSTLRANEISDVGADDIRNEVTDLKESLYRDENGNYLKAYINGETKVVSITDDLYRSLQNDLKNQIKDLENRLSFVTKPLQTAARIKGNLVTSWSPTFLVKNAVKDVQDAIFNSKDTKKFMKYYPSSFKELAQNKTELARQFRALYGSAVGQYIGTDVENTTTQKSKNLLKKFSNANEIIELAPRYAEFKASLENGASIQEAMYNAREITTNFSRGGTITKALNRNGFNFLNASTQGLDKFIRNFSGENGAKGFTNALIKAVAFGVVPAAFNELVFGGGDDKDEEYEALPDYIKDNYYLFKTSNGEFIRIPKGRTLSVFGSAARRTIEYLDGEEDAFDGYFSNTWNQIGINNPEESFLLTPLKQAKNNKAWYGGDIVPTRLQDKPVAEQYDETTDLFSKWLGKTLNISPKKINYIIDQYSGGIGDMILPTITPAASSEFNTPVGKMIAPIRDQFVVNSVDDNKYVSDFYTNNDKLKIQANSEYATEEDILKYKYSSSVSSELSQLYKEKRLIQNDSSLSNSEKFKKSQEIKKQINEIAKDGLNTYNNVNIVGNYAEVNDRTYYKNGNGEWNKATDSEIEEMDKLGLTAEEKNNYYNSKNEISKITAKYKKLSEKASEEEKKIISANKKLEIITKIKNTKISNDAKAHLYEKYYGSEEKLNVVSTLGINLNTYLDFELQNFESDKDVNGNTIKNSKKIKMINYLNSINASYGEKLILYKLNNLTDTTYNQQILNYLNRTNLSFEEKKAVLEVLKMKIDYYGNVRW